MISARKLAWSSGQSHLLRDVDIEIAAGEGVGVTSATEDGRATLLRVLATLLRPTGGALTIAGVDAVRDIYRARRHLAYAGTRLPGDGRLQIRDYLDAVRVARLGRHGDGHHAVDDVMARAGLPPHALVETLAAEAKARLVLAAAVLVQPRVLLVDGALGPITAPWHRACVDWLREVRDAGTTLVVSLADGDDLVTLCHRVEHVDAGRLVASSSRGETADVSVIADRAT